MKLHELRPLKVPVPKHGVKVEDPDPATVRPAVADTRVRMHVAAVA